MKIIEHGSNSIYKFKCFLKHDKRLRIRFYTCTTEAIYLNHRTINRNEKQKKKLHMRSVHNWSKPKLSNNVTDEKRNWIVWHYITWEQLSCQQHIWVIGNPHDSSLFHTHEIAKVRIIFKHSYSVWILWQITHFIPKSTIIWTFNRMVSKIIE